MEPPKLLVKTWLDLVCSGEEQVVKHALKMLKEKIGDHKAIEAYMKKHNLK
ncbi:hypothetical protein GCM10011607_12230 [Shewanella inventionis]|uniref:Uncharacterized protein n=1 Tax=Shewanella inventionis TaxID=1738770 RepID=A0ABQ1IV56_9GAMM|nr:hypothetical protein [Shewanella inventionis]GGB53250.1 hypothetical protein GCM10011607_12230 [Shewanella inventionis]